MNRTELNLSTWEDSWDYEQLHFCLQSHNLPIKNEVNSLHTLYNNFVFKKGDEYYFIEKNEEVRRGCFEGEFH